MLAAPHDPSPREVRVFGLLWLVFFSAVAGMAVWRPEGLLSAAAVLTVAWLASLAFNPDDRRRQLAGAALPLAMAAPALAARWGTPVSTVVDALGTLGVVGAGVAWAFPAAGKRLFVGWMTAALPVGWTISHVVLAIVYYAVMTPIGFALRLGGYDPMKRRFDREAASYWIERRPQRDPRRYLRQF